MSDTNSSVIVRWSGKLESASNGRGHTRFRSKAVAELRDQGRMLVRPHVQRWVVPDPVKAEKARQRATERLMGEKVARYLLDPVSLTTPLVVTMVRVAPSTLDDDNLRGAFKPVRDGVADALGSDDRTPMIEWRYEERRGTPAVRQGRKIVVPAEWGVEIRIEERAS